MPFRPFRRPVQNPAERAMLRARRFLQIGQFDKAAALLAELADGVDASGRPRAAGELHARAAHCYVAAGYAAAALAEAEFALQAFQQAGMPERMAHFLRVISGKMQARGMLAGVESLQARFGTPASPGEVSAYDQRVVLPTTCPQCGAPLHRDEIEWIHEHSAECAYCGAVIEA